MARKILINNEMELASTWGRLEKFYLAKHRMTAVNYWPGCNSRLGSLLVLPHPTAMQTPTHARQTSLLMCGNLRWQCRER